MTVLYLAMTVLYLDMTVLYLAMTVLYIRAAAVERLMLVRDVVLNSSLGPLPLDAVGLTPPTKTVMASTRQSWPGPLR